MGIRESILKATTEKEVADLAEKSMGFAEASYKTKRRIGLAMERRLAELRNPKPAAKPAKKDPTKKQ
jgi:hypothetical protein